MWSLQRITIPQIKSHPWFLKNLPIDIMDDDTVSYEEPDQPMQNMNGIMQILAEATIPPAGTRTAAQLLSDGLDVEENMEDLDSDEDLDMDIESSGEVVGCPVTMSMLGWKPYLQPSINQSVGLRLSFSSSL